MNVSAVPKTVAVSVALEQSEVACPLTGTELKPGSDRDIVPCTVPSAPTIPLTEPVAGIGLETLNEPVTVPLWSVN